MLEAKPCWKRSHVGSEAMLEARPCRKWRHIRNETLAAKRCPSIASAIRPEWGNNNIAQGRAQRRNVAKRRPGSYCDNRNYALKGKNLYANPFLAPFMHTYEYIQTACLR